MNGAERRIDELLGNITPVGRMDTYRVLCERDRLNRRLHDSRLTEFEHDIIAGRLQVLSTEYARRAVRH